MDAERLKTVILAKRQGLVAAANENDVYLQNAMTIGRVDMITHALKKRAKINRRLEFLNEIIEEAE